MNKYFGVFLVLIACVPVILFFISPPQTYLNDDFSVKNEDKVKLVEYAYTVVDQHYSQNNDSIEFPRLTKPYDQYHILFITILQNGSVRGCQSGSVEINNPNRIFLDVKEAVVESLNDDRFGGKIMQSEAFSVEIMFTFLYDVKWVDNKSLDFLQHNIELGVHAVEILTNDTPVIFKESVPISNNYDHQTLLNRLCNKADLRPNCYQSDDVDLYRYNAYTYMGDRSGRITDLYRYNILLEEDEITQNLLYTRLQSAHEWFQQFVKKETGRLEYQYYPSIDQFSTDNNHIRQLAALWSLTELQRFLNTNSSDPIINEMMEYYLGFMDRQENYSYLTINNESKLAYNAFIVLSLLNMPEYPDQSMLLEHFAQGILSLQEAHGGYQTYFFSDVNTGVDYYPGEAMLSLMKLYEQTKNNSYLNSVHHAFGYYKPYWQENKNTAFIPWHTQTYALLYHATNDQNVAEFIFEMNDWLIDSYQIKESMYPDEIGGFPKFYPTFSTSVFLEGITDAYTVAVSMNDSVHTAKYQEAVYMGIRFVLQTQFTRDNAFYIQNKSAVIGGFRTSLTDNMIRIDNTQHGVMALMNAYNLDLFPLN